MLIAATVRKAVGIYALENTPDQSLILLEKYTQKLMFHVLEGDW